MTDSIAAALARIEAKQEGFDERLVELRADAREARDVARSLSATLAEHDVPGQLSEIRLGLKVIEKDFRTDLGNTYTQLKRDIAETEERLRHGMADHDAKDDRMFREVVARVDKLESVKDQTDGAKGLMGFLTRIAPLLLSLGSGFLAALALKVAN